MKLAKHSVKIVTSLGYFLQYIVNNIELYSCLVAKFNWNTAKCLWLLVLRCGYTGVRLLTLDHHFPSNRCSDVFTQSAVTHCLTDPTITVKRVQITSFHVPELDLNIEHSVDASRLSIQRLKSIHINESSPLYTNLLEEPVWSAGFPIMLHSNLLDWCNVI